jgi:hypothetical protein
VTESVPGRIRSSPGGRDEPPLVRQTRRVALLMSLLVSVVGALGSAAALLPLPNALPVAGGLALLSGLLLLPPTVLLAWAPRHPLGRWGWLLLVSSAAALGSLLVGGALGPSTTVVLLPAILPLVVFGVGGRPPEEDALRRQRARRWGRQSLLLGATVLFLAVVLYFVYAALPPVQPLAHLSLSESASLTRGETLREAIAVSPGEEVYALVATPTPALGIEAELLSPTNGSLGRATAGSLSDPQTFYVSVEDHPGSYQLWLTFPNGTGGAPANAAVNWTLATVPAWGVGLAAVAVSFGVTGVPLLIAGGVLLFVGRPVAPRRGTGDGPGPLSDVPAWGPLGDGPDRDPPAGT